MPACSAFGCTNRPDKKVPGLSFFRFPKNEKLRRKWIIACRRRNWLPSRASTLCSDHFNESQIDRSSLFSVRLLKDAVPVNFKAFPHSYKNVHFEDSQYEQHRADKVKKLKPNAVPTLFDFSSASVSKCIKKKGLHKPGPKLDCDSVNHVETAIPSNNPAGNKLNASTVRKGLDKKELEGLKKTVVASKTRERARLKNTALPSLYLPVPYANMPEKVGGQQIVAQKDPGPSINEESCKKQNPNIINEIRSDKRDGAKALLLLSSGGPLTGVSNQRWLLLNTVNRNIGPTSSAKITENESEPISTNSETTKNPSRVSDNVTSSVIENDEECYEITSDVEEENALSIFRDEEANSEVSTNSEEILFQENETEEDSKEILKEKLKKLTVCYENSQRKLKEYQRLCKLYVKEVTALREVINNLKQINSVADNYFEAKS